VGLIGSVVTLALGLVVALGLLATSDLPGDYYTSTPLQISVFSLIVLAAPLALLVAWGEFDLSVAGAAALGATVASGVADGPDGAVAGGVLVAALVGALAGGVLGLVRWLTRAHPALLSFGAGTLLTGIALWSGPGMQGDRMAVLDGSGLPILLAVFVVGAAAALAATLRADDGAGTGLGATSSPGPRVIVGFALSGLGAAVAGSLFAARAGYVQPGQTSYLLVLGFTAVAVAGVVRGGGIVAPLVAIPGAVIATLLSDSAPINGWSSGERDVILGAMIVVTVALAWGLQRVLARPATTFPTPGPFPAAFPPGSATVWAAPQPPGSQPPAARPAPPPPPQG
jgi:ribose/xylose/arabinose/galactoside ABC-type transport system permease subunit